MRQRNVDASLDAPRRGNVHCWVQTWKLAKMMCVWWHEHEVLLTFVSILMLLPVVVTTTNSDEKR